jgi:hypothetical protein
MSFGGNEDRDSTLDGSEMDASESQVLGLDDVIGLGTACGVHILEKSAA